MWSHIESLAGKDLTMLRGAQFTDVVAAGGGASEPNEPPNPKIGFRKGSRSRSVEHTAVVQDLQGPWFVDAILMDERVRAGEW